MPDVNDQPPAFLHVSGRADIEQLLAYLSDAADAIETGYDYDPANLPNSPEDLDRAGLVVLCAPSEVQWLIDRFASGMYVATRLDTWREIYDARQRLRDGRRAKRAMA